MGYISTWFNKTSINSQLQQYSNHQIRNSYQSHLPMSFSRINHPKSHKTQEKPSKNHNYPAMHLFGTSHKIHYKITPNSIYKITTQFLRIIFLPSRS